MTALAVHTRRGGSALARGATLGIGFVLLTIWATGIALYAMQGTTHPATGDAGITDEWLGGQLAAVGIGVEWYVAFRIGLEVILMGTSVVAAAFLLRVRDTAAFQPYLAVALLASAVFPGVAGYAFLVGVTGSSDLVAVAAASTVALCFLPVLFLFPTGRFVPRWGRVPAALAVVVGVAVWFVPVAAAALRDAVLAVIVLGIVVAAGFAQVIRYRRAGRVERQQTKWVALAVGGRIVYLLVLLAFPPAVRGALPAGGGLAVYAAANTLSYLLAAALAVAVVVAMRRHGLFEVDAWVSRSLAATGLAVVVVLVYLLIVGGIGAIWPAGGTATAVAITAVVGAALLPAYRRLLRWTNRLVYGPQQDPQQRITALTAELDEAQRRTIAAADAERARVHRELHDGIAPTLASVYQRIELAGAQPRPDFQGDLLDEAKADLAQALTDIRGMVRSLRPPLLDELGLAEAVDRRLRSLPPTAPRLRFTEALTAEPPAPVAEAAYWMIAEAVTNARRHSRASECAVHLADADGMLLVTVQDDGTGATDVRSPGGIRTMRERIEAVGGDFVVQARPAEGTTIHAAVPILRSLA